MVEKLFTPLAAAIMAFASGDPPDLRTPPALPPTGAGSPVQAGPEAPVPPRVPEDQNAEARANPACPPVPGRSLASMYVRDDSGLVVARVHELVIEPRSGQVQFAAISFSRMVGMGDVVYVVPWDRLEIVPGCHELRIALSQEEIKSGPRFSLETWPNFADEVYTASVREYYRRTPADRSSPDERRTVVR